MPPRPAALVRPPLTTPAPVGSALARLPDDWRAQAENLRKFGAEPQAIALTRAADELEAVLSRAADEQLTLEQAELESGYTRDHLRHLVASGEIPNAGRKGSPRIRRADLPRKPGTTSAAYDVAGDALELHRRDTSHPRGAA